ncbi:AraC-like DNA-binding protein [Chryseobacterium sp. H1D6B]|uniref:helix-turn-helix domain-containing protein n=1 Tax=Chryseobacterium sp. H1D6B TaxID=2940588 RepID=UPI0015CDB4D7|nr:AraC family transcriptional regulator [Chryseobacterium sp. H1D6B]MDH6252979.1 AraC-like DNA-binding protein [Chryseobacterium sp. H1D6B]
MKLQFYTPKNTVLKKYIEGYYFFAEDGTQEPVHYWTFPNNYCIISVNQNADTAFNNNKITIFPSSKKNISANLVFRYISPIEVYYEKLVNEITIYFKPLGLNQFTNDLEKIFLENENREYSPFPDFKEEMARIFSFQEREQQIEELEKYWLSKLVIKDLDLMKMIVSDLEADLKIEEIAAKHHVSRQYISKTFLKTIGKTPSEYRKIYRFRNSIARKKKIKKLTELSYDNLFYDQSHFNKDFKELTAVNPKAFFKNVDIDKENVWLFI